VIADEGKAYLIRHASDHALVEFLQFLGDLFLVGTSRSVCTSM